MIEFPEEEDSNVRNRSRNIFNDDELNENTPIEENRKDIVVNSENKEEKLKEN